MFINILHTSQYFSCLGGSIKPEEERYRFAESPQEDVSCIGVGVWQKVFFYYRIMESLRLENILKIKSNYKPNTTKSATKSRPQAPPHLHVF